MTIAQKNFVDDSGTGEQHMDDRDVGGTAGSVPLVKHVDGALDFAGTSAGNVFDAVGAAAQGSYSGEIDCDGYEYVVVKTEHLNAGGSVVLRPFWKDGNATPHWTAEEADITLGAQNQKSAVSIPARHNSAWYVGRRVVLRTYGALAVRFWLRTVTNGQCSVWADAV